MDRISHRVWTVQGDDVSRRLAEQPGDTLAAPTILPCCVGRRMGFPGTTTIPAETLMIEAERDAA